MICELVHIEHSFWKGGHTFIFDWLWTTCIWYRHLFSPLSLSLSLPVKQIIKKMKWSVDYGCSIIENNFFLFKIFQISTLFWASLRFLGKMVIFAGPKCQNRKKKVCWRWILSGWLCICMHERGAGVCMCMHECGCLSVHVCMHGTCVCVYVCIKCACVWWFKCFINKKKPDAWYWQFSHFLKHIPVLSGCKKKCMTNLLTFEFMLWLVWPLGNLIMVYSSVFQGTQSASVNIYRNSSGQIFYCPDNTSLSLSLSLPSHTHTLKLTLSLSLSLSHWRLVLSSKIDICLLVRKTPYPNCYSRAVKQLQA